MTSDIIKYYKHNNDKVFEEITHYYNSVIVGVTNNFPPYETREVIQDNLLLPRIIKLTINDDSIVDDNGNVIEQTIQLTEISEAEAVALKEARKQLKEGQKTAIEALKQAEKEAKQAEKDNLKDSLKNIGFSNDQQKAIEDIIDILS